MEMVLVAWVISLYSNHFLSQSTHRVYIVGSKKLALHSETLSQKMLIKEEEKKKKLLSLPPKMASSQNGIRYNRSVTILAELMEGWCCKLEIPGLLMEFFSPCQKQQSYRSQCCHNF